MKVEVPTFAKIGSQSVQSLISFSGVKHYSFLGK
jgi:hypothetical protein